MAHTNFLFTSESVSEGHPDKVCDQISDAILDAFLENDIKLGIADDSLVNTRLGCETLAPPTRSSSPAKAAARRRCSASTATRRWSIAS